VHLAGVAHNKEGKSSDQSTFERVNVEGATRLARAALEGGVRRFVFVSSIGVLGNRSDHPLTEADTPSPVDLYARSKHKAELQLARLCAGTSMDLVILRPTLVYGPGCL
jgi:nucleoside-diphosphate-sugar epimerase